MRGSYMPIPVMPACLPQAGEGKPPYVRFTAITEFSVS